MTTCPKCGGKNIIGPRYCSGRASCPAVPPTTASSWAQVMLPDKPDHPEHLADICATCLYWQARPCLDERKPS